MYLFAGDFCRSGRIVSLIGMMLMCRTIGLPWAGSPKAIFCSIRQEGDDLKNLWVPISGAIAQQRKVDTIANNVANANTTGFKKDGVTFREYITALDKGHTDIDLPNREWAPEDFYRSYGAENAMVKVDGSFTDFTQGQLAPTGNPLDLALNGPGFIEVLAPGGVRYTRRGTLGLNPEGYLVTDQGHRVLSKPEDPLKPAAPEDRAIQLPLTGAKNLSLNLGGEIFIDGQPLTTLSVAEFKDPHALRKEGHSLYINPHADNRLAESSKTSVNQGFVEQSNVNTVAEMSELIKAHRHFESIQKAIKAYDEISAKGVNEIGRF